MKGVRKMEPIKRNPMTDEEVIQYISLKLNADNSLTHTRLLHILRRDDGRACEQKRFRDLFRKVKEQISG